MPVGQGRHTWSVLPGGGWAGEHRSSGAAFSPTSDRSLSTAHTPRSALLGTCFSLCAPSHAPPPGTSWGSRGSACPACVAVGVAGSRKSSSASELDMAPSGRRLSGSRPVTTTIPLALDSGRGFGRAAAARALAPSSAWHDATRRGAALQTGGPGGAESAAREGGRAATPSALTGSRTTARTAGPPA